MSSLFTSAVSLVMLLGLALVMNINNGVAVSSLAMGASSARQGLVMRVCGLSLSLLARLLLILLFADSLRPEFNNLPALRISASLQRVFCLCAGVFLLGAACVQIRRRLHPDIPHLSEARRSAVDLNPLMTGILLIAVADVSLSFDSLIAVAGMAATPLIMLLIVGMEVLAILFFAEPVSRILRNYPRLETLAMCALLLMGAVMVLRAVQFEMSDLVVYGMISFALLVELVNMRVHAAHGPHPRHGKTGFRDLCG
ncbi:MAG: hypothetical protein EOM20_10690 [Spartobacteria bacterium]|nr:hypothetical protein [Spartobacteria bacterium]